MQSEFASASLDYLLDVTEPFILSQLHDPSVACGYLSLDEGLVPGKVHPSCDGRFRLALQPDGNLVLYQAVGAGWTPLWSTGTIGAASAQVIMQADGNLVLHDTIGAWLWDSNTGGNPGAYARVQDDGNFVVYSPSHSPLWATDTCCH